MLGVIAKRIFGSANERYLKRLEPTVAAINAMEGEVHGGEAQHLAIKIKAREHSIIVMFPKVGLVEFCLVVFP